MIALTLKEWKTVERTLDERGAAHIGRLFAPPLCRDLQALYDEPAPGAVFRKRIVMARHGFGQGEYKYFAYPLPDSIADLREQLYANLVPIANRWHEAMGLPGRFPLSLGQYLARCHAADQTRPTPLLLRYGAGDYNCLHQDLYGGEVFPLQVIVMVSRPGVDFAGGELVLTEQRPRMQSIPIVMRLEQGEAAVIAVNQRPKAGTRGFYRVTMRHGVAQVREVDADGSKAGHVGLGEGMTDLYSKSGNQGSALRYTAGIIFHDAA